MKKNILALAVVSLTFFSLWFAGRPATTKDASWEDVVSEARAGNYKLITTENLKKRISDTGPLPLIVDTRQAWEFRTGHIEGAVNFPMEPTWLSRWQNKTPLNQFLGPDKKRVIVFY